MHFNIFLVPKSALMNTEDVDGGNQSTNMPTLIYPSSQATPTCRTGPCSNSLSRCAPMGPHSSYLLSISPNLPFTSPSTDQKWSTLSLREHSSGEEGLKQNGEFRRLNSKMESSEG